MTTCEKFSQKILISLNSLTGVLGASAIVGGIIMKMHLFSFLHHLPVGSAAMESTYNFFRTAPYIVIGIGSFIFLVSVCGSIGATRGSLCLLKAYKIVILLLLFGLITMAGLIFGNQGTIKNAIDGMTHKFFVSYTKTSEFMDIVQIQFKCCGVHTSRDWEKAEDWKEVAKSRAEKESIFLGENPVPDSCCVHSDTTGCGLNHSYNETMTEINQDGCSEVIWDVVSTNADVIGLTGIIIACILMLCVFFSCSVISLLKNEVPISYKK